MKNIVVGTAGHIDHGKTTLVKTLTGIDTDRLKEEKEKGITIEVGFAHYCLPSGQIISIVDVPGHEKFIKNMLRGISGVDIVILVIAADDGPMPQTKEHLDIVSLLNIQYGLVVITKIDLVDEALLQLATEETRNLIKHTFLEGSPLVYFSARTGKGISEIVHTLEHLSQKVREKDKEGPFRLPIDRIFTMRGHGTVVTGTIVSGRVKEGDEVEMYPLGEKVKIRGIQVHNQKVFEAVAGQRVGINIPQLSKEELERGMVLGDVASFTPTHLLNASFHYLQSNRSPLENRMKVRFHCGTSESIGRVLFLDRERIFPGDRCLVQFRLEEKVVLAPYDRYIVRGLSPMMTIGGGIILEPTFKKYRGTDTTLLEYLHLLEKGVSLELIEKVIESSRYFPLGVKEIAQKIGTGQAEVRNGIETLLKGGKVVNVGNGMLLHVRWYENLKEEVMTRIKEFHCAYPLERDVSQEELKTRIDNNLHDMVFACIIDRLVREGTILVEHGRIRLRGYQVWLNLDLFQQRIANTLEQMCKGAGFTPLSLYEIQERFEDKVGSKLGEALTALLSERVLVKVSDTRVLHREYLEEVQRRVSYFIREKGTITLQEYKQLFSVGRMAAQVVLEYLDKIRFTLRVGDKRKLR